MLKFHSILLVGFVACLNVQQASALVNLPRPSSALINLPRPSSALVNLPRPASALVNLPRPSSALVNLPRPSQKNDTARQNVLNLTLQQCLEYAYLNQDSMKNARIDLKIARETVRETVGRGLPNLSLNSGLSDNVITPKILFPAIIFNPKADPKALVPLSFVQQYQITYTAQATQLLFDASYLVGLKAAAVVKNLSIKSLSRTKIQTTVQVTKSYYNVLASQERLKLASATITRIAKNLSDIRAMNKAGFAELIDVQRSEVQYNNAVTDRKQAMNGILVSLFALKFQIGMPLENMLAVVGEVKDVNLAELSDTTSLPYAGRIEYSLTETQVEVTRLQWRNAKTALLPRLSAFANYGEAWNNNTFSKIFSIGFPSSLIGLQFSWNFFDGGQTIHRINESRYTYEKAKNSLHNTQRGIQFQVQTSRLGYMNNLSAVQNQQRNRELAENVYRSAKIKYTEGIGSNLELSDAEINLEVAETNYINSLLNVLVSKVDLDAALGNFKP